MASEDTLEQVAKSGDINKLYLKIKDNPKILEEVDAIPFVDTPLHTAAFAGQIEFSVEIMRLKPSFGLKMNTDGLSPIHVALRKNHHNLTRFLISENEKLARVKGREGLTPLHFLCQSSSDENIRFLIDFLKICPDSIKDVNAKGESALHIALGYGNLRAFRVILGWLKQNYRGDAPLLEASLLRGVDLDGNNILHLATLKGNEELDFWDEQAIDLLLEMKPRMHINAKNFEGKTALDLAFASDLAEALASGMIKRKLLKAGAKLGASVPVVNDENKLISIPADYGE
ncbi:hypothetical protein PIB30_030985 [Stylosanthes scabra]|uniref:Uncharacterized protein n=1 Tax=Stylosanthes scabra TaxID=79078 RepID=A0ABU6UEZ6_9FABA|nr:hypothetical protein [Stylosanthes scabra]